MNFPHEITFEEFINKSLRIPVLTDYIRAETMMSYLQHEVQKVKIPFINSILNVKVLSTSSQMPILTVSFEKSISIENDMGVMGDSIDDPKKYIQKQDGKPIHV